METDRIARRRSPMVAELRYALHLLTLNKLVLVGIGIAVTLTLVAMVGPFFVPSDTPIKLNFATGEAAQLGNPQISWAHPLGVDTYGRDMLNLIILALGLDMGAAGLVVGIGLLIGVLSGAFAGYIGGKIDELIMRVTDIFLALPLFIWAMAIAAVLSRNLNSLILALATVSWPGYTRIIRGQVLIEKGKPYVEGLQALGVSRARILIRHVIPNSIFPLLVQATLDIGGVILTIAALTFLGLALNPLIPELGALVSAGQTYIQINPYLITFPGLAIVLVSLSFNLVGDGLRDILDPRLRR
ncbi:MAG: ABC transporter permease [Nitrososphaerales archaeon]